MTPEQMREAAAKAADNIASVFFSPSSARAACALVAEAIRKLPLTAPEPMMLDRIAGAIYRYTGNLCSPLTATKVLEAMRAPTEAMIVAAAKVVYGGDPPRKSKAQWVDARDEAIDIYHAMIDAALAEK